MNEQPRPPLLRRSPRVPGVSPCRYESWHGLRSALFTVRSRETLVLEAVEEQQRSRFPIRSVLIYRLCSKAGLGCSPTVPERLHPWAASLLQFCSQRPTSARPFGPNTYWRIYGDCQKLTVPCVAKTVARGLRWTCSYSTRLSTTHLVETTSPQTKACMPVSEGAAGQGLG